MAVVRGKDFKLYRNSDDPYDDDPTWVEVTNIRSVTVNKEKALADASTRASSYRKQVGTLKELTFEFQMVYDNADADFVAFKAAYDSDANLELLSLDGSIEVVGNIGTRFPGQITNFTENQDLEDVGLIDVTVVVGYQENYDPRDVQVTAPGVIEDV
jgi:hypothetical protein